jgi:putative membrane protein
MVAIRPDLCYGWQYTGRPPVRGGEMKQLIVRWIVNSTALLAVAHLVSGVALDNWATVFVAALVLGLLNAFLRPVLIFLTLPVTVLSLGLFTLVINAFLFYLAAHLVRGFHVAGFGQAFVAALVFSIVSFFLNLFIRSDNR